MIIIAWCAGDDSSELSTLPVASKADMEDLSDSTVMEWTKENNRIRGHITAIEDLGEEKKRRNRESTVMEWTKKNNRKYVKDRNREQPQNIATETAK